MSKYDLFASLEFNNSEEQYAGFTNMCMVTMITVLHLQGRILVFFDFIGRRVLWLGMNSFNGFLDYFVV